MKSRHLMVDGVFVIELQRGELDPSNQLRKAEESLRFRDILDLVPQKNPFPVAVDLRQLPHYTAFEHADFIAVLARATSVWGFDRLVVTTDNPEIAQKLNREYRSKILIFSSLGEDAIKAAKQIVGMDVEPKTGTG